MQISCSDSAELAPVRRERIRYRVIIRLLLTLFPDVEYESQTSCVTLFPAWTRTIACSPCRTLTSVVQGLSVAIAYRGHGGVHT